MSQLDIRETEPLVKEQLALLIERETRYRLDDILKGMQELAGQHQIGGGVQRSPLRNLLVAATDRTSLFGDHQKLHQLSNSSFRRR